jgi:hypothetical protein
MEDFLALCNRSIQQDWWIFHVRWLQIRSSETIEDMSSDGSLGLRKEYPFPSPDIFSMTNAIEVNQELEFYAPLARPVKYFEGSRLDQGIRLPIDCKADHLEDFRSDRCARNRSFPAPRLVVYQQSSEIDTQWYESKQGLLLLCASDMILVVRNKEIREWNCVCWPASSHLEKGILTLDVTNCVSVDSQNSGGFSEKPKMFQWMRIHRWDRPRCRQTNWIRDAQSVEISSWWRGFCPVVLEMVRPVSWLVFSLGGRKSNFQVR